MTDPAVSVLVTTYNHERYVEEALESLRAQTSSDFETIITDDASTDDTARVIEAWLGRTGFPAEFIPNERNQGICANRNRALARARGAFVCSLAGDDAYAPDRVAAQLACFRALPADVAAVYSDMTTVDADGNDLGKSFLTRTLHGLEPPLSEDLHRRLLLEGNFIPAPATMVRRSCLDAVGPYDESLAIEDYDMWLRLSHRFGFHYLPGELVRYRVIETSLSRRVDRRDAVRDSNARILSSWLDRCPDTETRRQLADRVWAIGRNQWEAGDAVGARRTLRVAARAYGRPNRRLVSWALDLPGGVKVGRSVAGARSKLRRRSNR